MGDNNEIPLVFQRFVIYDVDQSRGLSSVEIEKMPDNDASALFEDVKDFDRKYGGRISQKTLSVFNALSLAKAQAILRGISNTDKACEYFELIAKTNIDQANNLLLAVYQAEAQENSHPENMCSLLLKKLEPIHRQAVISKLRNRDFRVADAIEKWELEGAAALEKRKIVKHDDVKHDDSTQPIFVELTDYSSSEIMTRVFSKKRPSVIGFGESHGYQKEFVPGVPATAERFAYEIRVFVESSG